MEILRHGCLKTYLCQNLNEADVKFDGTFPTPTYGAIVGIYLIVTNTDLYYLSNAPIAYIL